MNNYRRRCTKMKDVHGRLIHENDRCKSWYSDECHPDGGFVIYEVVKFFKNDWYLFEEHHNYRDEDDKPVLLSDYLVEVEVCGNEVSV